MLFIRIICAYKEKVVILQQIMYNMLLFMQIDWDLAIKIATIASPIVGVIAIIVALCIARSSAKHAQRQIDVFMAAQAPDMLEALGKYEQMLEEINSQINDAEIRYKAESRFIRNGALIEEISYQESKKKQKQYLDKMISERERIELQIRLISSFLQGK